MLYSFPLFNGVYCVTFGCLDQKHASEIYDPSSFHFKGVYSLCKKQRFLLECLHDRLWEVENYKWETLMKGEKILIIGWYLCRYERVMWRTRNETRPFSC